MALLIRDIVLFIAHQAFYFMLTFLQTCWWACNGTRRRLQRIKAGGDYENSAHVLDIVAHLDAAVAENFIPPDFIATHRSFESPEYVLKANVSLFSVTKDEAIFVEVPEDEDIYDTRRHPFFFIAQMLHAVRVIRLPFPSVHRIAAELGDPSTHKTVLLIHHISRCGSTLLTQMMNRLPGSTCISEPHWSLNISNFKDQLPRDEYRARIRSIFRLICKVEAPIICIKTFSINWLSMAQDISEVFPRFQQFLMYRNPVPHLKSRVKSYGNMYSFKTAYIVQKYPLLSRILGFDRRKILEQYYGEDFKFAYDGISDDILDLSELETICLRTALWYRVYLQLRRDGCQIFAVRYEDLMSSTVSTLRIIMDNCGLSSYGHCIGDLAGAIHHDSQEGLAIGWATSKKKTDTLISPKSLQRCAEIYKKCIDLPPFEDDPWCLP